MEYKPTKEQQTVLDADLVPLKVEACAGSGKTATAVRRLVEVRRRMGRSRGYAVLLSYSNVAVDTFRQQYAAEAVKHIDLSERVLICTVDSFIANNVLLPHGAKVMDCSCRPFLAHGRERFLENKAYSVFDGVRPVSVVDVDIRAAGADRWEFINRTTGQALPDDAAIKAVKALGKTGAYTHALGRFWAIATLSKVERIASILSLRFPQILVDEAQDIGTAHGELLTRLADAGSILSLVGDPHQAIFEFADANGSFLKGFKIPQHGVEQPITENRRSVAQIVQLANKVAGGAHSKPIRVAPNRKHGAYYLAYDHLKPTDLIPKFSNILAVNDFAAIEAAVLTRGASLAFQLGGGRDGTGVGATKLFSEAALHRDVGGDIAVAFERALDGIFRLVEAPDSQLRALVMAGGREPLPRLIRVCIWRFLRDAATGIPTTVLSAQDWHSLLKKRIPAVLVELKTKCGLEARKSWSNNVTTRDLGTAPLCTGGLLDEDKHRIRICTVHKVKGESIPAVLYVTNSKSINSLLRGAVDEEGRIGYVAVTRAADLLIVAVPKANKATVRALAGLGLVEWVD